MECSLADRVKDLVDDIAVPEEAVLRRIESTDARKFRAANGELRDKRKVLQAEIDKLTKQYIALTDGIGKYPINPNTGEYIVPKSHIDLDNKLYELNKQLEDLDDAIESARYNMSIFKPSVVFKGTGANKVDREIDYSEWDDVIADYTNLSYVGDIANIRAGRDDPGGISKFLDNAEQNFKGTVYRGSRLESTQLDELKAVMAKGSIITNKAPMSTSVDPKVAVEFSRGSPLQGKKHAIFTFKTTGHDIKKYSTVVEEDEVLLANNKYFQVIEMFETDMQVHVLMEEVPAEVVKVMKESPEFASTLKTASNKILGALGLGLGAKAISNNEGEL